MTKKKKAVTPKFFIFLLIVAVLVGGVLFAVHNIGDTSEMQTVTPVDQNPIGMEVENAGPETQEEEHIQVYSSSGPRIDLNKTVTAVSEANPSLYGFSYNVEVNRNETKSFNRAVPIDFGHAEDYSDQDGLLTFGGNHYRNTFAVGTVSVQDKVMKRSWEQAVGATGSWGGTGWTGQPLIIQWSDEIRPFLGIADSFKEKEGFTEVIYPAMDGRIYFFELETGNKTRTPIDVGVVMKSTPCLDPRGWPLLYVGQSIQQTNPGGKNVAFVFAYSLIDNSELTRFGGFDYFSDRNWQAYDGSPLISNDTLIYGGENGVLYTVKLNTEFDKSAGKVSVDPERLVKYSYKGTGYSTKDAEGSRWLGIESSVSCFEHYVYFTDNGGRLQCVDLNTMELKFVQDVNEDADATVVIDEYAAKDTICLYTASQVKNATVNGKYGYSFHRCFDGLTGALLWEQKWIASTGESNASGGTIATPQVGKGNVAGLVFYSMNSAALNSVCSDGNDYSLGGKIIAYNKLTGDVMWSVEQTAGFWSTPVLVYDENNKGYLIQCDQIGKVKMFDAISGNELASVDLGSRIDSTPAVYGQYLVVGTRGKGGNGEGAKIFCVKIS